MNNGLIVTDAPQVAINDLVMAKQMADDLHTAYPGHLWAVAIDKSFLDVRNLYLSGNWGFRLSIPQMYSSSDWDKKVLRAGGEILERYRQRRAHADDAAIDALPTNFAGRHNPEL